MKHEFEVEFFDGLKLIAVDTSVQAVLQALDRRMMSVDPEGQTDWRVRAVRYLKELHNQ